MEVWAPTLSVFVGAPSQAPQGGRTSHPFAGDVATSGHGGELPKGGAGDVYDYILGI